MLMNSVEQKTAKRLLGIVNATVKHSTSECAIGGKQTEKNLGNNPVSGATENWRMELLKKWPLFAPLKQKRPSAIRLGAGTKCSPLTEGTSAGVAGRTSVCFCRLTMWTITALKNVTLAFIEAVAPRSISGYGSQGFPLATKFCV